MSALTSLGLVHTAIGLVAVIAGFAALLRDGRIVPGAGPGRWYVWATVLTCLTGFGIFRRGGFNEAHALGALTLVVLAAALLAERGRLFGALAPYVSVAGLSLTLYFHFIPGITETFTRLPASAPAFSGPDDPALQAVVGTLFVVYLAGVTWQVRRRRAALRTPTLVRGRAA